MTEKQEAALRQALEALESCEMSNYGRDWVWPATAHETAMKNVKEAITALREALAEQPAQQQEPVVWMYQNKSTHEVSFQKHMRSFVDHGAWYEVPLYSEPLANQEKTSGSPKPAKPEALRLAELFEVAANAAPEGDEGWLKTAAELRRMHDLLGKANALCRIRAEEIERLKAQPAQEPVAWADLNALTEQFNSVNCGTAYRLPGENRHPLYTSPPASKPWVGLTQQDIDIAFDDTQEGGGFNEFARALEAKLREKNA